MVDPSWAVNVESGASVPVSSMPGGYPPALLPPVAGNTPPELGRQQEPLCHLSPKGLTVVLAA